MSVLALETSCDDTCAAVIDDDGRIRANVISSQTAHEDFVGVVPEIADRVVALSLGCGEGDSKTNENQYSSLHRDAPKWLD